MGLWKKVYTARGLAVGARKYPAGIPPAKPPEPTRQPEAPPVQLDWWGERAEKNRRESRRA